MNYEWLFSFRVFSEHLSFTYAAKSLHLSQPALHVQIRKLGEVIGCPLYRRIGRSLSLTPEGKRLATFAREVEERGRSVLGSLRGEADSGPIALASGYGAFQYMLGPAIRRFLTKRWPLRLVTMSGPEAIEAVRDARAHLGVVAAEEAPADLRTTRLRSVGQKVVLPKAHRLAKRRSIRAADLDGEKLVVAPSGSPHRAMVSHVLAAARCKWTVAVEANGWEPMLQFAKYGVGITIANDFCPPPTGMVGIRLEGAPAISYYLIERAGFASDGTKALGKLIVETASLREPLLDA
jgi:LysR family transcriptional regulator, low CO2-responsive transcriptional regulator